MIVRLKRYIFESRGQFVRFFVVGLVSVLLDMGLLVVLKEWANFRPVYAVALNQLFVVTFNFAMNKYWSFASKKMPLRQLGRYLILVAGNYALSLTAMYLLNEVLGWNYKAVRLATIGVLFLVNFILYKRWVYKD